MTNIKKQNAYLTQKVNKYTQNTQFCKLKHFLQNCVFIFTNAYLTQKVNKYRVFTIIFNCICKIKIK